MLSRIIIGYDGSTLAREAFAYSVVLADAAGIPLLAVRAIEPDPLSGVSPAPGLAFDPYLAIPEPILPDPREIQQARDTAEKEFNELADYAVKHNVRFDSLIEAGVLSDVLQDAALPNDVIAVGMHGRFRHAGIGSATKHLVAHGPCPLMIVSGPLHAVNRVLAVHDGTPQSRRCMEWSVSAAGQLRWPLSILAVEGNGRSSDEAYEAAQALAPDATVVNFGAAGQSEAEQIERTMEHARYALLAMGAYPDGLLHQLFFGGTTGHVLRNVDAPVVLVR